MCGSLVPPIPNAHNDDSAASKLRGRTHPKIECDQRCPSIVAMKKLWNAPVAATHLARDADPIFKKTIR